MFERLISQAKHIVDQIKADFAQPKSQNADSDYGVNTSSLTFKLHRLFLSKKDIIEYLKILQTKLEQKQDIANTLELMDRQLKRFYPTGKASKKKFYRNVLTMWEDHNEPTLVNVLKPYLTDIEAMILESAESNADGIRLIVENHEKSSANRMMVVVAALSPLFYIGAIFGMANSLHEGIVVDSANIVTDAGYALKGSLQAIVGINETLLAVQWLVLPVTVSITIGYYISMPLFFGELRLLVEKIPLIGLPYKANRANTSVAFLQTLGALVKSGMAMESILTVIQKRSSPFLKHEVSQIKETFELRGRIGDSLETKLFSKDILYLLSIYLQSNEPSREIPIIAEKIQVRQDMTMKALAIGINLVGMIVLAIYLALFSAGLFSVTDYLLK